MSADEPGGVVVTGPLARYEAPFRRDLVQAGYAPRSVRNLVRAMARASRWLEARGLQADGITPPVADDLEAGVPGTGPVLRFLRHVGVAGAGAGSEAGPVAALLAEFGAWLAGERGLSPVTVRGYRKHARVFLAGLAEPLDGALQRLDAGQVTSFMLGYCQGRNTESAKAMVTAIRALLRFLHVSGRTPVLLAGAVPAVAGWRLASLPRGLAAGQVARLLDGCDRDTVTGRRDYAILTVLARLGLRGAEAAAVQLGDIDWRAGEVMIRGKGARLDRLPLPVPVGEALAAWLTGGRARCGSPAVFVTVRAPYRQLSPEAVRAIMGRACDRAGVARRGAHRLRHSLATEMLRAGASLPQVGQVLRHRSQLATSVYAKVDENALRVLARPWPGGAA
jgi:integrase/recombinase XerD